MQRFAKWAARLCVIFALSGTAFSQTPRPEKNHVSDSIFIRKIFDRSLTDGRSYEWLEHLSLKIGHRLSGSEGAEKAVRWGKSMFDTLGLDSVWLQPCMVPKWVRGPKEEVQAWGEKSRQIVNLRALALGGSVGTAAGGLTAEVVEVKTWDALDKMGEAGSLRGKIVFFNRPMEQTHIHTFTAYGHCVDQRAQGASRAAKFGAVGVLVRSMSHKIDEHPHTGSVRYDSAFALIPAAAISTLDAENLSKMIPAEGKVTVSMRMGCQTLPDVLSYNVIGEIRGSERPNDFVIVGGHLDSWDVGHGSHDDGAGCVQSMDVLRLLKNLGYRPRHSIRAVLFMNEENGLRGARKYADEAKRKGERHLLALESDSGGFTPRGFGVGGDDAVANSNFEKLAAFSGLLEPYGLAVKKGGGGADVGPLASQKGLIAGYQPDSQRYFDHHHAETDVFSAVNKRELELGAASMAALVFLVDKYLGF